MNKPLCGDVLMGFGHCVDNLTKSCCTVPAMFPKEEDIVREVISKIECRVDQHPEMNEMMVPSEGPTKEMHRN